MTGKKERRAHIGTHRCEVLEHLGEREVAHSTIPATTDEELLVTSNP